jgi:hypothetical protein
VCKFVVEDKVFVKKEKINDEFVAEKEESELAKIEDEFGFEEKESDFVTTEKIKVFVNSNRRGVSDFPKLRVTRVGHDSAVVPVHSTNTTKVTRVKFLMDIHGGSDPIRINRNANRIG